MKSGYKIAIDAGQLERDSRGMGFFLREFLSHLSKANRENFEFRLVRKTASVAEDLPFPSITENELDESWVVWFPFNHPTFNPKGKHLVTIHDLAPFVFPQGEKKLQKKFREGAENGKKVITDSGFISQQVEAILQIPEDRVTVIYPGFEPAWPDSESFNPQFPYILAIGPAEPRKNFERLLLAFARLKKQNFPHKLVIVGELPPWPGHAGPFRIERGNPLPRLAKKLKIASEAHFPGIVSRELLARWYRHASLVTIPSLYEGFGFPVLEAYSWGLPLACSHAASLPEVAGEGAFYFNPEDEDEICAVLYHALTDEKAVAQKRKLAEKQLKLFSWDECIAKYLEAFRIAAS